MPNYEDEYAAMFGLQVPEMTPDQAQFAQPMGPEPTPEQPVPQPSVAEVVEQPVEQPEIPAGYQPPQFESAAVRTRSGFAVDQNAASNNALVATQGEASALGDLAQSRQRETEAQRDINAKSVESMQAQGELDREYQAQTEQIQAEATEKSDARMAQIQDAVEAAAGHTVDPGRLWNTDAGTKTAGVFAAFVGGFLAPILGKNDIQGIIDRGIDRDIQAQQLEGQQLEKNKQNLIQLDGLYEDKAAQRAAELRVNHIARKASLINDFEAQVQQLQDPIIREKGMQEIAKLKLNLAEKVAEERKFQTQVGSQEAARKQQDLNARRARAAAAARQKREHAFKLAKEGRDRAAAAAKAKAKGGAAPDEIVYSPNKPGVSHGQLPAGLAAAEKNTFRARQEASYKGAEQLKKLVRLMKQHGSTYDGPGGKFMRSTDGQRVQALYKDYIFQRVKANSGAQATDAEREAYQEAFPLDTFMTRNVEGVWTDELSRIADDGFRAYNQYGMDGNKAYKELSEMANPISGASKATLDDALIQGKTDDLIPTRIGAIDDLTYQIQHNKTTVGRPEVAQVAKQALDFVNESGTAREKAQAREAYGAFQKEYNAVLGDIKHKKEMDKIFRTKRSMSDVLKGKGF